MVRGKSLIGFEAPSSLGALRTHARFFATGGGISPPFSARRTSVGGSGSGGFQESRSLCGGEQAEPFVRRIQFDDMVLRGIANDYDGIAAIAHDLDLLFQHLAEHRNALVGGAKMLLPAVGDRTLG